MTIEDALQQLRVALRDELPHAQAILVFNGGPVRLLTRWGLVDFTPPDPRENETTKGQAQP